MNLSFNSETMLLANVNVRSEVHGEEREPAADLKFECEISNDALSELHPALKGALYHFDEAREADLADQGKRGEAGYLPHLRFTELAMPLKWDGEMAGASLAVRAPGKNGAIELTPVKVNSVSFEVLDGGWVRLVWRAQAHPSQRDFGELAVLVQTEVEVALSGPDA